MLVFFLLQKYLFVQLNSMVSIFTELYIYACILLIAKISICAAELNGISIFTELYIYACIFLIAKISIFADELYGIYLC